MLEDEVRQTAEEAASENQPKPEDWDVEMIDQEVVDHVVSSASRMETGTEDQPRSASGDDLVSPEEDKIFMGGAPQPESSSPGLSETASVSGDLAGLQLASPSRSENEEEGTPL